MKIILFRNAAGFVLPIFLFFSNVLFGQTKTYVGSSSGNWNVSSNWSPSGIPTSTNDVIIPTGKTVTISSGSFAKSISISGTLNINNGIQLTAYTNFTVNSGGSFVMPGGSSLATLVVYGNYTNNGLTDFWKSTVVIAGNLLSPATSTLQKQGNVVVGGDIIGDFDTTGGNGTGQIFAVNPNANVSITPTSIDSNVVPGVQVTSPETQTLIDLVNSVIYGASCSFSSSTTNVSSCSGTTSLFSVTTTASSPSYQWQVNMNDGTGWNNLTNDTTYSGVTSINLTIANVSVTMNNYKYRARVTSGGCSKFGNYGVLMVSTTTSSVSGSVTGGTTICSGSTSALLTLSGSTGTILRWESSVSPFSSWTTIANTSATYASGSLTQTTQFRAVFQNGTCSTATSTATTVTVNPNLPASVSIVSNDADNTICSGTSVTFTATPVNGGTPSYQWKLNGTNVGTNSNTYTTTGLGNNAQIAVVMTSTATCATGSPATSNTIVTTVNPNLPASVSIVSNDADNTICSGTSVTFTATPVNGGTPGYQWKLNGTNVGTNSNTYTTTGLGNNDQIAVVMTSTATCATGSPATSNTIVTTVSPISVAGTVSSNQTITEGTSPSNIILTGSVGAIQWQSSTNNVNFTNITGGTSATLLGTSIGSLSATTYFRAIVKSGACSSATSGTVTITVQSNFLVGTVSTNQTICSGTPPSDLSVVGSNGTIQWQSSTDNVTFSDIVGATSAVLSGATIGPLTSTTYFKCIVTRGQSQTGTAGTVTISVGGSTTWNGTLWSNGAPTSVTSAIISGNYNVATNINACSLTVNNNAIVLIPSGYNVSLNNALTVANGSSFTLENNANLLQQGTTNSNSGAIVVKRNSSPLMRQDYTLWSSPVANQNVLAFSPNTLTNRFYGYDSSTNFYTPIVPSTTVFSAAKGLLIRVPNTHPSTPTIWAGKFTGVPNNGNYTYNMYYDVVSNPSQSFIYNLVGNPYPSPISMARFVADNSDVITGTLYFWRETNGNTTNNSYCAWSGGTFISNYQSQVVDPKGIIQTGQGFFVEAKSASPLVFKNSQREANNSNQFFRTSSNTEERNTVWLNATNTSGAFSQMAVGYISGATQGVDLFDGKSFGGGPIALSSILEGTNYVIQGRALPFDDSDEVPLGFRAKTAGDFSIAIDHAIGFFASNQDIFLKDNLTNTLQNLKVGPYTFSSDAGSFNSRFVLVFKNQSLGVDNFVSDTNLGIVFTNNDNMITIQNNDLDARVLTVDLYNLVGQVISTWDVQNENQQKMQLQVRDLSIGTYLVKVHTSKGSSSKKIIIKNTKMTLIKKKIEKELPKERSVLADED